MKEVLGSLPEVITAYKNYNLLVPTATDVQLNPFYKFHVEEVPVDLGENSGDIFKVGSVKTGKKDERGKDIWEDVFSLMLIRISCQGQPYQELQWSVSVQRNLYRGFRILRL